MRESQNDHLAAPTDSGARSFLALTSRPTVRTEFKVHDGGRTAVSMLRWVNIHGERGPWSRCASAACAAYGSCRECTGRVALPLPPMTEAEEQPRAAIEATPAPMAVASAVSRQDAARRWVAEHGDALWRFAVARARSADIAEEIVQETMLAALQAFGTFSGASSERTWLLGIAAHKVADHFRRSLRGKGHGPDAPADDALCDCAACRGMFTPGGGWAGVARAWPENPQNPAEKAERIEALRLCIEALPPGQAEAVWTLLLTDNEIPVVHSGFSRCKNKQQCRASRLRSNLTTKFQTIPLILYRILKHFS